MGTESLKNLVKTLRANLAKLDALQPPEDTPLRAKLRAVLSLRIVTLEAALRHADELASRRK